MISLDQIVSLEHKVETAIARIDALTRENKMLKERCESLEQENNDLHRNLMDFQKDQTQIEQGILNALSRLDSVENAVVRTVIPPPAQNTENQENPPPQEQLPPNAPQQEGENNELGFEESHGEGAPAQQEGEPQQDQSGQHDIF